MDANQLQTQRDELLKVARQARDLLERLWTNEAPTVAEIEALTGRLYAVIGMAEGQQALPGFTND